MLSSHIFIKVMVEIRRKEPNAMNMSECEKGDNVTIVSTTLLIGENIKFYKILAKQHVY